MLLIAQILLPITAHLTFIATKVAANALICSHNIFYSDQNTSTHTTTTRFFPFHKRASSVTTSQYGAKALVLLVPLANNLYYMTRPLMYFTQKLRPALTYSSYVFTMLLVNSFDCGGDFEDPEDADEEGDDVNDDDDEDDPEQANQQPPLSNQSCQCC